jgi:tRNA pseudouridine38-40 synthase
MSGEHQKPAPPILKLIAFNHHPMPHWKLILSYDGTSFHGWQVQPGLSTIQGTLAQTLHHLTGETILPQGSGRTDAGVHALAQVTSFSLEANIPPENLQRALNRALPPSIRILSAEIVPETFHARHSAIGKTYEYRIFQRRQNPNDTTERICPPFLAPYVWDCRWNLDPEPMQEAAALLLGTHDFTSFAAADPDLMQRQKMEFPSTIKTLKVSTIIHKNERLIYTVSGSGFLHHMVRNIVGTLAEVGRKALIPKDILRILKVRDRSAAGPTAPSSGLFLQSVDYPQT